MEEIYAIQVEVAKEKNEEREKKKENDAQVMRTFYQKFFLVLIFSAFTLLFFDLYINWLAGMKPYFLGIIPINFNYVGYHAFPYTFIVMLPWLPLIIYMPRYTNYWLAGMVTSQLLNDLLWPLFCKDIIGCIYREFWSNKIWMYIDLGTTKIPLTGKEMLATVFIRLSLIYGLLKAKPFRVN